MKSYIGARFFLIAVAEHNPDTLSTGIEAVIGADFSHIAILVELPPGHAEGPSRVFESTIPKSRECSLEIALEGSYLAHKIEFTHLLKHSPDYVVGFMRALMGIPYGYDQFPALASNIAESLKVGDNDLSRLVCSEFGAIVVEHSCSLELWANEDYVNPKQCIDVFTSYIKGAVSGSSKPLL